MADMAGIDMLSAVIATHTSLVYSQTVSNEVCIVLILPHAGAY